ncbi:Uncharacterised protein g6831 [Pycnogonum litorale]
MPSLNKDVCFEQPGGNVEEMDQHQVSKYLADNPQFLIEWFRRHSDSNVVERIIDDELEKRLANTNDLDSYKKKTRNGRNSVTTEMFNDLTTGKRRSGKKSRHQVQNDIQNLENEEIFMQLIRDIANELDVDILCHKILVNVSILTNSDRGSLFLAKGPRNSRYLVPQLFDVTADSVLEDQQKLPDIRVPFGVGIAGYVAQTKESIIIKDAYQDERFNKAVDKQTGYRTVSILCKSICNCEGEVIGVAQIINKSTGQHEFTAQDEQVFEKYLTFCGIGIQNAQLFELSVTEFKRNQLMLNLAKGLFEEQSNLEKLVRKIMSQAKELLRCEGCGVYLTDKQIDGEVVFRTALELRNSDEIIQLGCEDLENSSLVKLAKRVISTGQPLKIDPTNEDSLSENHLSDLEINTLLSMPIYNREGQIIGAAQLMNKINGTSFAEADVNTFEAFAIFCGLGIHNAQMYDNICKLSAQQNVALEVLSFHATATHDETHKLVSAKIQTAEFFDLYNFSFSDFKLTDDQTCHASIRMFLEWDFVNKFQIPYEVLCRWTLSVRRNYRPVTYHNWRHALNVAQTMFAMITTGGMSKYLTNLEAFALMVACLCHDLDHRGTNNTFQTKTGSPLAQLYGTSTMEHHHFDQCIMIINSERNNIFQSLSADDYRKAVKHIENAILSTDLALYFEKKGRFIEMIEAGQTDFNAEEDKDLLRAMMMTACDVSAITKPWEIQKEVAILVSNEFFEQGDLEKEKLKEKPIAMMDRDKRDELPNMQCGFIDFICIPVYKAFSELNINLLPLYDGVLSNRKQWKNLEQDRQRRTSEGTTDINNDRSEHSKKNGNNRSESFSKKCRKIVERKKNGSKSTEMRDDKIVGKQRTITSKMCTIT